MPLSPRKTYFFSHQLIQTDSRGMTTYAIRKATSAVTNAIFNRYGQDTSIGPRPLRHNDAVGKMPSQLTTVIFHLGGDAAVLAGLGGNQTSSPPIA